MPKDVFENPFVDGLLGSNPANRAIISREPADRHSSAGFPCGTSRNGIGKSWASAKQSFGMKAARSTRGLRGDEIRIVEGFECSAE